MQRRSAEIESSLEVQGDEVRRYEDKTSEELSQDVARKRKQQFAKMTKISYYQFGGIVGAAFFYLFVYRRFLHPKSITNSVVYNQVVNFAKASPKCK